MNRYHHIVVGIDFSAASLSAYSTAVRLASRHGTPLTVVHVVDPKLAGIVKVAHQASDEDVLKHVQQSVRAFLEKSEVGIGLPNVELDVGHPLVSLVTACKRHGADLLVLGTQGTEHGPNQVGAVAAQCVRKAPADVLLVREGMNHPFTHITACVDFSEHSANAVRAASCFAADEHAPLDCLFVFQSALAMSMDYGGFMPGLPLSTDETAEAWSKDLDAFVKPLLSDVPGSKCRNHVLERMNIRDGILDHVRESKTDLVVLGTRGKTDLKTFFMGTTAERIVTHAPCSVLAVKPEGFVCPVADAVLPLVTAPLP
jgi:nucleotide-binding universal stress UspA family protein